jgi:ferredoxin
VKKVWLSFVILIALVISASWFVSGLWGGKEEKLVLPQQLVFTPGETIGAFMEQNKIPEAVMTKALGKTAPTDKAALLGSLSLANDQLQAQIQKAAVLSSEQAGKDWQKILPKFALWAIFLYVSFRALRKGQFNRKTRKWYYLGAVVLFGVAFGSDPSPMGTVKDAIVLLAKDGVVFPPRLLALTVFLLSVVLANKAICSWGCQFGVLQDLIFRMNRNKADTTGILKQYKIPFAISNSVRVVFFLMFTAIAIVVGMDIIEYVDPFKTFNPAHLGIVGAVAAGILLVASLFIYRPWCHFFCPFGLVSWLLERFSLHKIRVDESACTLCGSCERACPSDVMGAILHKKAVIPDCFSCGTCTEVCPTKAISFGRNKKVTR